MEDVNGVELGADRPKASLAEDKLGYAAFARALARSVARFSARDGMVLAINGPWGSGKTSAANMVVEALAELQRPIAADRQIAIVKFNPWWFSGQEDLMRAFFDEVSSTLEKSFSEKVIDGLKSVGRRVSGARDLVLAGAELAPGGSLLKGVAAGAFSVVGKYSEDGGSLSSERTKLCSALLEQDRRILVIIDDVDRLPANEARQIFRLVKSVADLPNVIHLLLFDREAAQRVVGEPAEEGGPEWLEKIVQASFDLPPVLQVDINRLFLDGLATIVQAATLPDQMRWQNTFHDAVAPWLRTPRDVSRLLNVLAVAWPMVSADVDLADFVGLEAMRVFEPKLHAFVRGHPEVLIGLQSDRKQADPNLGDRLLGLVPEPRRAKAQGALERLFPRLESVWSNHSNHGYDSEFLTKWDRERRACSPKRFAAYFTLAVSDDALSRIEFDAFVAEIADEQAVRRTVEALVARQRAAGGTKAAVLLEELSARAEEVSVADLSSAIVNLIGVFDLFANPADERDKDFLGASIEMKLWWALHPMLARVDEHARLETLQRAFREARPLLALTAVYSALKSLSDKGGETFGNSDRVVLAPEVILALGKELLARIQSSAHESLLLTQTGLMQILHTWANLADENEVRSWSTQALQEDANVLLLAKAATQMARVHMSGDVGVSEEPRVHRAALQRLVNVEQLTARLASIASSGTEPAASIVANFNEGLNRPQWS